MADVTQSGRPPFDEQAEAALIGCILLDNRDLERVPEALGEQHFYREQHRILWRAIRTLVDADKPVDIVTITGLLRSTGELRTAGGASYLSGLTLDTPPQVSVEFYARRVMDLARVRDIRAAALQLVHEADTCSLHPAEFNAAEFCAKADEKIGIATEDIWSSGVGRGFATADTLDDLVEAEYANPSQTPSTVMYGWPGWDRLARLRRGWTTTIMAQTNGGKTALARNIAFQIAAQGIPVHYDVREDTNQVLYDAWLSTCSAFHPDWELPSFRPVEIRALVEHRWHEIRRDHGVWRGHPFPASLAGGLTESDAWAALKSVREYARSLPITFDDSPNTTVPRLRARFRRIHRRTGCYVFIVDHIHELGEGGGDSRYDRKSKVFQALRDLVVELNLIVICLAQVGRKDGKPTMFWAKETGEIEQASRQMWGIYRPEIFEPNDWRVSFPHPFQCHLVKNKGPLGAPTMVMDPLAGVVWEATKDELEAIRIAQEDFPQSKFAYLDLADRNGLFRKWQPTRPPPFQIPVQQAVYGQ